ncbi:MAG TPA: hypothetical protein VJ840_06390 [Gemmatimonadaceae bacterium]|nr:hypothetical protein [Gemmatimonadaceae bacterium]
MTDTQLQQPPRLGQVIREQFKATALVLRAPAIAAGGLALFATFLAFADFFRGRASVEFSPELSMIPAIAGGLIPIAVWFGEQRFGPGFFWTLPVDRVQHSLAKVLAGWLWLMIAVIGFVLWLLTLALITKGQIAGDELIHLLPTSTVPPPRTLDPSMLRTINWVPQPVFWLAPFFAGTGLYAISSALMLGLRHPFKWAIGVVAGAFAVAAVSHGVGGDALATKVGHVFEILMFGRYGLDGLLSARTESLHTVITLLNGESATVWRGLPVISEWLAATLLWTGIGFAGLAAALMRHRERR